MARISYSEFYKHINFDVNSQLKETYVVKQNDTLSRGFYVKVIQNGRVVQPTAYDKMTLYVKKPDGTDIFEEGTISFDRFKIGLPNQALTVPGTMRAEFTLRGGGGEIISSKDFTIIVNESFPVDPVESTDEFGALQSALAQIAGFAGEIQDVQLFAESIKANLGELEDLDTVDKENAVAAINELNSKIGDVLNSEELETLLNAKVDKDTLGDMSQLQTEEKEILVLAINELFNNIEEVREVSDVSSLIQLLNNKADKSTVGNIANLVDFEDEQVEINNLVDAVNYLYESMLASLEGLGDINFEGLALSEDLGDKTTLTTTDKTNIVNAINEINQALKQVESVTDVEQLSILLSGKADKSSLGNLSELNTTQKNNLVNAINELKATIDGLGDVDFSEIYTLLDGKVSQEDFDAAINAIELTPGPPGEPGQPGADGEPGQPGQDGKSAYQIWLDEGNAGTEQEFLDSLQGPQGPPGEWEGGEIDLPNKGSISAVSDTGKVNNEHSRQVNVSGGIGSSGGSTASGQWSQVNASQNSTASELSSQVNAGRNSIASGRESQVNASYTSTASGQNSQVNASGDSIASATWAQVNASTHSTASGRESQVNASSYSRTSVDDSQVNVSKSVENNTGYSSAWGYGAGVNSYTQNIKIHLLSQSGDINHSGVLNSGHNFTDFAELFPNLTGEAQGYGLIQTIDGHGVRPANSGDQVVGVTSATAGVILGEVPFSWQDRWLKDEWGAFIMEDVVDEDWEPREGQTEEDRPVHRLPKENPEYDPELEYTKRQERPDEWSIVGLVGQVYVRLDENVEPMDYVKPLKDGIGQTSAQPTKLRVMKITQAFDADKGYKIGFCLLS